MANSNDIIAKTEAIDTVVTSFNTSLKSYLEAMDVQYKMLRNQANVLYSAWAGKMSKDFKEKIEAQMTMLLASLKKGEELLKGLKELETKVKAAMQKLRAGAKKEGN